MSDPFHPYASLFVSPNGPGDARPTGLQIIQDNDLVNKWQGKVALVTGGTSGIGTETARMLLTTGADVFITARDMKKGQQIIDEIVASIQPKGKAAVIEMDMTSLESVKKAAQSFLAQSDKLNILVNNAGIMAVPKHTTTKDGFEQQFGVNHLAHYTLTATLLPTLIKSSTADFNSRVVAVTSAGHGFSTVHFDDPNLTTSYDPWVGYGQSKTANLWLANYIDRVYGPSGVHANAVHPGGILTPLWTKLPSEESAGLASDPYFVANMKSVEQGAATTVWAATANVWEGKGGKYLADCGVGSAAKDASDIRDEGYAPHAHDVEGEDRLWKMSGEMTGVVVVA